MSFEKLVKEIQEAKQAYYQTGTSPLTDVQYDELVDKAKKLGYIDTVGSAPVGSIKTIEHEHPMLSLDKVHTANEIKKFSAGRDLLFMYKADGLTVSCTYVDGLLTRLETRGDGAVGNDILFHAKSFENLPLVINKAGKYVIDGECVILYPDFEEINERQTKANEARYSNPRNLAAGSLNQLDPSISKERHLRFYAWDVIEGGDYSLNESLTEARTLGFETVECIFVEHCGSQNNFEKWAAAFNEYPDILRQKAKEQGFPIDGIVVKYDDVYYGRSLGATNHHPCNAIAYKFEDDRYPTTLKNVTWQVGKTRIITPILNFEPVEIGGSVIERCTAHNVSIYKQLNITEGCTCYIYKANDVIPNCDCTEPNGGRPIPIPDTCPICGAPTKIVKENNSEVLMCTNENCKGALLGKLVAFASKKAMDINGLSEATLKTFINLGWVEKPIDLYFLANDFGSKLQNLPGFGIKSAEKLFKAIEKSRDVDLQHFIVALNIPGIGEGQSKLICKVFSTFNDLLNAIETGYRFDNIPGIGEVLNGNIYGWMKDNKEDMVNLFLLMRFKYDAKVKASGAGSPINGKTFVITGTVHHFKNRDALKEKIESLGGKVAGSVSKNTDYLINNDAESNSSKNVKAKQLGVKIIDEDTFMSMITK